MTRPGSLKQGLFPVIMGFPDLSKAPDLDLAGDLDRMARVVSESMAAPIDFDLDGGFDRDLGPSVRCTELWRT